MRILLVGFIFWSTYAQAKSVYLNGSDISSARGQRLRSVNVRIDESGNVFIEAPHYQINEEKTAIPLSALKPALEPTNTMEHKAPAPLPETMTKSPTDLKPSPELGAQTATDTIEMPADSTVPESTKPK